MKDYIVDPCLLKPGMRVRINDRTLQAFYGVYGTVVRSYINCRSIVLVEVQMDDTPRDEGPALFYLNQVHTINE